MPGMADSDEDVPRIVDDPDASRFEAWLGDRRVGFTEYRLGASRIVFLHTEIDPAVEGRGIGSRLVAEALRQARGRGLAVTAQCPFVAAYLRRHPEAAG